MTALIIIDESGDLGPNGSQFYIMAAVITGRSRHLSKAAKEIPTHAVEPKYYNSDEKTKSKILNEISSSKCIIIYVCVDKHNYKSELYDVHGKKLYRSTLKKLFESIFPELKQKDVNIIVDESSSITIDDLREMAKEVAIDKGKNVKKCEKGVSHKNKCIQIADFTVGSIREKYENDNDNYYNMIEKKISVARMP